MNNMYNIPKFWINLEGLTHSLNLNIMESCITRVFCMQGALSFHCWLSEVIPAAVDHYSCNTWLDNLASDVGDAINNKKITTFDSANYLPNLTFHHVYLHKPAQFQFNQTELIVSMVSSIIRLWFNFPPDEYSILQLSLINIVTSKLPSYVLLDKLWDMYKSPFAMVFNKWNKKTSKIKIHKSLAIF